MTRGQGAGMKGGPAPVMVAVRTSLLVLAVSILCCAPGFGVTPTLPVSEVHAGQKGYGLSDFGGGRGVRKFDVEILGTLKAFAPHQDLILARLTGEGLEKAGVIAGMSGSPVYIDEKLVGAVAYGWPFSSETIAGITPIKSMLDIRHAPAAAPVPIGAHGDSGSRQSTSTFVSSFSRGDFLAPFRAIVEGAFASEPETSGFSVLPLPVSFSAPLGRSALFSEWLARGRFVETPSGGRSPESDGNATLSPGSSVSTILISGDMSLSASGTVTWVEDGSVLAFGHPFLSMGPVEMPMASSEVIAVLPSVMRSFKFATAGRVLGSITQDRSTGILGSFGTHAPMVPVSVSIATEKLPIQEYKFEIVRNSMLTPILAAIAIDTTLSTLEKSAGERTLVLKSSFVTPGRTVRFDSVFAGLSAKEQAVASIALLTNYLMANEFHDLTINGIEIRIEHSDVLRSARITEVEPERERVRPGETVPIRIGIQDFRAGTRRLTIDLPVPADTPPGPLSVFVGDGNSAAAFDLALFPADPRSLDQVLDFLDRLKPSNTVNLLAYRAGPGALVEGQELASLPPTVFSLLSSRNVFEGVPDLTSLRVYARTVEQPVPMSGSARLTLEVTPRLD